MAASSDPVSSSPPIQVSMPEVVKFIRQLAHDLRNHLNAAELQSAYLVEIAQDNEVREEIKRLRGMISQVGTHLQALTVALSQPRLTQMPYGAHDLVDDLRQRVTDAHPEEGAKVAWSVSDDDRNLNIDPQLLLSALEELFANAFRHQRATGTISFSGRPENGNYVLILSEPKQGFERSTENWGREPLRTLGQGRYGLGLHRSRAIVEAHGGTFDAHHDPAASVLVTRVLLPLVPPAA
jgi:K+-sensing histidine kinase KdpD